MGDDSTALYENPWDPVEDLLYRCYHAGAWENRICTALVVEDHEDVVFQVANLFGDAQGLSALCGILEKVFLPILVDRKHLSESLSEEAVEHLREMIDKRRSHLERLQDMFFQEIYPPAWAKDGVLERVMGTQKWLWKPLILMCHKNPRRKPTASLSSVALLNGVFQVSVIVSVIRSLLSTMMEEDLSSQTMVWFESNKAYWKLWLDWAQAFYDDLGNWQQAYDKKGTWNSAQGKICRVLRPFSTFFPSLSLFVDDRVMDKAGMVRIWLYHTFLFQHWVKIFIRCLYREKFTSTANDLQTALNIYSQFTEAWVDGLTAAGITNIGYHQSIIWGDAFLENRPLPPLLYFWKDAANPKRLEQLKNFFSNLTYQRTMFLDLLQSMYTHNDVFARMIRDFGSTNRHFYRIIQSIEFTQ